MKATLITLTILLGLLGLVYGFKSLSTQTQEFIMYTVAYTLIFIGVRGMIELKLKLKK